MKKVLVPTDFSGTAENGLKFAVDIVKKLDGEITLLNVVYPARGTSFSGMGDVETSLRGEARHFMAELVRKNKERLNKQIERYGKESVKIIPQIDFEDKVHGLENFVKEHEIDLIVMGTRERKSLTEYIFGSHTENLIKASNCPVISVKEPVKKFTLENIVFAADVSSDNSFDMKELRELAEAYDSEIHFLYVINSVNNNQDAVDRLKEIATSEKIKKFTINTVDSKDPDDAIERYSKRVSADMVAVASGGKSAVRKLLFGSVSYDIINNLDIPVLVIPEEE